MQTMKSIGPIPAYVLALDTDTYINFQIVKFYL